MQLTNSSSCSLTKDTRKQGAVAFYPWFIRDNREYARSLLEVLWVMGCNEGHVTCDDVMW
jgi:hypothetical protein